MKSVLQIVNTIAFTAILLTTQSFAQKKDISLDDIWKKKTFRTNYVYGIRSMNDGKHYTTLKFNPETKKNEIHQFSYTSEQPIKTIIGSDDKAIEFRFQEYQFSADEKKVLLSTAIEPIYRHSTREHNYVYDLESKKLVQISESGKQRYATFSPNGSKVAFVKGNNLYYIDLSTNQEVQITEDGQFNKIINGATDWVYEEEFAFDKAFFWSPDGKKIGFYKFDESEVKEFNMVMYENKLYPRDYKFKYPKAGEDNSRISIHIYHLDSKQLIDVDTENPEYIPRIKWSKDANQLAIQKLNRHQNDLQIVLADANNGSTKTIYSEKSSTYIDITDDWTFLDDKASMIISSEKSGYNHIYKVDFGKGTESQITKGNWDVTSFYGMDKKGYLYYASAEQSPMQRAVYKIKPDGSKKIKLSVKDGWNRAHFSKGMNYFINNWSDANTPNVFTVQNNKGKVILTKEDNTTLVKQLGEYNVSKKEFFNFKTEGGYSLNAWMIKPQKFEEGKKYPVLVTIYGGPGSQTVKDSYDGSNYYWHQLLANKGYIVVSVDNRGTGARGADFKKMTYKQLGKLETEDYIQFAKYLGNQPYVDGTRIGIWGWSYGGYMSSLALSKGAEYYKAAIAVAPVTNWRYYDNIYTERYMQKPQENASGYDDNSPINHVGKIKGNYLLVHGTADDNVHFQNTAEMVNALMKADIQYDFYMYTDKNHGIYGGNARHHLYKKMTDFLIKKL